MCPEDTPLQFYVFWFFNWSNISGDTGSKISNYLCMDLVTVFLKALLQSPNILTRYVYYVSEMNYPWGLISNARRSTSAFCRYWYLYLSYTVPWVIVLYYTVVSFWTYPSSVYNMPSLSRIERGGWSMIRYLAGNEWTDRWSAISHLRRT